MPSVIWACSRERFLDSVIITDFILSVSIEHRRDNRKVIKRKKNIHKSSVFNKILGNSNRFYFVVQNWIQETNFSYNFLPALVSKNYYTNWYYTIVWHSLLFSGIALPSIAWYSFYPGNNQRSRQRNDRVVKSILHTFEGKTKEDYHVSRWSLRRTI